MFTWLGEDKSKITNDTSINIVIKRDLIESLENTISTSITDAFKRNDPEFDPTTEQNAKIIRETAKIQIIAYILNEDMAEFDYDPRYSFDNLKYWFKMIHNDRWWDYSYLLDMIKHKTNHMIERFKHNGHCVETPDIIRELNGVVEAIDNIKEVDEKCCLFNTELYESSIKKFCKSFKNLRKWWD